MSQRTKRLIGEDIVPTGNQPGDFGPQLRPGEWTGCQNRAADMGAIVRRFNRYSAAMPAARAASDVNKLGDDPGKDSKGAPCLTRLPDTGAGLTKALGLPPGTIKDGQLRNDTTGFRAAMYRDDSTGKLILVSRDTESHSLVDWKTNIDNGSGKDTDQYAEMRDLSGRLTGAGVNYDVSGYSKGGGLAQEGGLMAPDANVYVFNSAGLPDSALTRTGNSSFNSLDSRTKAFSADGDFLTYMNNTTDPNQQIANAQYLRNQLSGPGHFYEVDPIELTYRNPATLAAQNEKDAATKLLGYYGEAGVSPPADVVATAMKDVDPGFQRDKQAYLKSLDGLISSAEKSRAAGLPFNLFPPVRSNDKETVVDSMTKTAKFFGAEKARRKLRPSVSAPNERRAQLNGRRRKQRSRRNAGFLKALPMMPGVKATCRLWQLTVMCLCGLQVACVAQEGKHSMSWFSGKEEALEKAIDSDSAPGVESAIRAGANPNAQGESGVTPLEYALGHFRKKAFQELLRLGASPAQRDAEKDNVMTLAVTAFAKDPDYLALALKSGGDPNTKRPDGDPIIVRFINDRNLDGIRFLKEHGADIDARNRSEDPLILYAANIEYWDVAWCLLELGARYDYKDEPYSWPQIFNKPKVTPPDSPLWPDKVKSWKFLKSHGVKVPDLPGA